MALIDDLLRSGLVDEADAARFCRVGHFVYESGDHGDTWLALELLFANPRRLRRAAARLAERLWPRRPDLVCGPLVGGALVGQWVAHELNARFVYAERQLLPGPDAASRYVIPPAMCSALHGRRVAIVDDAINAGAATLACVQEVEAAGGRVVVVGSLLARTVGGLERLAERRLAVEFLDGVAWNTWPPHACPLCRLGVPIDPSA